CLCRSPDSCFTRIVREPSPAAQFVLVYKTPFLYSSTRERTRNGKLADNLLNECGRAVHARRQLESATNGPALSGRRIRKTPRRGDYRDGTRGARRHAALPPGEHVLPDRLRHVRLCLLPVP